MRDMKLALIKKVLKSSVEPITCSDCQLFIPGGCVGHGACALDYNCVDLKEGVVGYNNLLSVDYICDKSLFRALIFDFIEDKKCLE